MNLLRSIWHKSFVYKKLEDFVEAKASRVAIKMAANEIWTALEDIKEIRLKKKIGEDTFIYCYTDSIVAQLIFKEYFEQEELLFLKRFLNTNDTFVDIGANIGLFSLIASKSVGSAGLVLAFEPASVTYNRLLENIALNNFKNIRPFQFALSDTNGHAELQILSNGYDAWNSLSTPPLGAEVQVESVETQTLDSCFERERIPFPVLMKVDVEGWEVPVLRGAKKLLSDPNAPCLIVEFTEQNARNAGFSCHELYDLLVFYGYKLFTYDAAQNRLIPESRRASYPYVNVIATKSEELVMNRLSLSFKS